MSAEKAQVSNEEAKKMILVHADGFASKVLQGGMTMEIALCAVDMELMSEQEKTELIFYMTQTVKAYRQCADRLENAVALAKKRRDGLAATAQSAPDEKKPEVSDLRTEGRPLSH